MYKDFNQQNYLQYCQNNILVTRNTLIVIIYNSICHDNLCPCNCKHRLKGNLLGKKLCSYYLFSSFKNVCFRINIFVH